MLAQISPLFTAWRISGHVAKRLGPVEIVVGLVGLIASAVARAV